MGAAPLSALLHIAAVAGSATSGSPVDTSSHGQRSQAGDAEEGRMGSAWTSAPAVGSGALLQSEERRLDHIASAIPVTVFEGIRLQAGGHGRGSGTDELDTPYSVWVDSGLLYISDTMNHRVQRWNVQAADSSPETVAGGHGKGRGRHQLKFPRGICVAGGQLYVADASNHRVMRWTPGGPEGTVVAGEAAPQHDRFGNIVGFEALCCTPGPGKKQLMEPHGVFVDDLDRLYIADTYNDRVVMVEGMPQTIGYSVTILAGGSGSPIQLYHPEGIFVRKTVDFSRTVYVADTGNNRVLALDTYNGTLRAGGMGQGDALNQLTNPTQIWVENVSSTYQGVQDGKERLYVCDMYNHRVTRYEFLVASAGTTTTPLIPILTTTAPPQVLGPEVVAGECLRSPSYIKPCIKGGLHYPPDPAPDRVDHINPSNTNPPYYHFWGPSGIFVDTSFDFGGGGVNITVADSQNHRVMKWSVIG